jgi:hypothetical protein
VALSQRQAPRDLSREIDPARDAVRGLRAERSRSAKTHRADGRGILTRVWRSGALFGATAAEAFRVRADEELNPPDVRALGQLIVEVVVVPTVPAEFVVFQIVQDPTGASLTEQ